MRTIDLGHYRTNEAAREILYSRHDTDTSSRGVIVTMVAGARLADGVLMAADCRITWEAPTGSQLQTDTAQKLIRIGSSTVLGYSGDVATINYLIPHIFATLRQRRRRDDAVSLSRWLPRFLARAYRALARLYSIDHVTFMAGGSISGRLTRVDRRTMMEAIEQTHALGSNNWLALRCLDQLARQTAEGLFIPGSSDGLLYTMAAPDFRPKFVPPLGVTAIGSGRESVEHLRSYRPLLMCAHPDWAPDVFCEALTGYFVEHNEPTVGGMLLMSHAIDGNVSSLCLSVGANTRVEVKHNGPHFVVRNTATGKEITLRYPSELLRDPPSQSILFNDFIDAVAADQERMRQQRQDLIQKLAHLLKQKTCG